MYSLEGIEKPHIRGYTRVKKDRRLLPKKPAIDHPWRSGGSDGFKYDPMDEEITTGLFNSTVAWEPDRY